MGPHLALLFHAMLLAVFISVGIIACALLFAVLLLYALIQECFQ